MKKYVRDTEKLIRFWLEFLDGKNLDSTDFIEAHRMRCEKINAYVSSNDILTNFTPYSKIFHLHALGFVTKWYLHDKSERAKEQEKKMRSLTLRVAALEKEQGQNRITIQSLRGETQQRTQSALQTMGPSV